MLSIMWVTTVWGIKPHSSSNVVVRAWRSLGGEVDVVVQLLSQGSPISFRSGSYQEISLAWYLLNAFTFQEGVNEVGSMRTRVIVHK